MQIKVKKSANKEIKPLYQQDKFLGLDAYESLKDNDQYDTLNHTEEIVDEKEANAELEKGEVVFDSMSDIPQMRKVNGKKHSDGGTPVKLERGAFVFSEFLKMSEAEKEVIGANGKNPSYANFANKFVKGFNESVHKLRTSDDDLEKDTAAMSVDNIKGKMAKLALLQESAKGFPNGIPEMAATAFGDVPEMKDGGMYKMQKAGEYPSWLKAWKKANTLKGKTSPTGFIPTTYPDNRNLEEDYRYWRREAGREFTSPEDFQKFVYSSNQSQDPESIGQMWNKYGHTAKSQAEDINNFSDQIFGVRSADLSGNRLPLRKQTATPFGNPVGAPSMNFRKPPADPINNPAPATPQAAPPVDNTIPTGDAGQTFTKPFGDTGYGWMEGVGISAPFMQAINRYAPIKKRVEAEQIDFRPVDFTAQRQGIQGQVNSLAGANRILSPTSSMASSRNAQLLGASLQGMNESYMNEFNTNQLGYQQVEAQNAQARQQANQLNAGMADNYDTQTAQMNENFDARKAQRFRQFLQQWQGAEKSRQTRNALNYMLTDYQIGPNSEIGQIQQSEAQRMARITGNSGAGQSSGQDVNTRIQLIKEIADRNGITFSEAAAQLNKGLPKWSESDTDNDGTPNSTRVSGSSPSQLNMMYRMLQQSGMIQ